MLVQTSRRHCGEPTPGLIVCACMHVCVSKKVGVVIIMVIIIIIMVIIIMVIISVCMCV